MEVDKMDLLQQQIIGLCRAHPEGFLLSQLSSLYLQMYKTSLELSDYGFHSTSGLLEHMKDVIQLDYDGQKVIIKSASGKGSAECSCPSSSMLEKLPLVNLSYNQMRIPNQHQVNKEARLKDELMRLFCCYPEGIALHKLEKLYKRQYKKHLNAAEYKFPTVQAMVESMNDILCLIPTNKGFTIKTKSRQYTRKMQERILQIPETSFGSSKTQTLVQGETKRDCKPGNKPSLAQPPLQQKTPTGNDLLVLQEEILNLIKDKSKGIPVRRIRKAYKTAYERPLNLDSGSLQDALKLMKNKLFVQHSGTYALVFENELAAVKLMEKLRAEILDLLRTEPNGIPEAKLCEIYNKKNHFNLRAKSYGFGSISELIRSMADVVDIVQTSGKNMIKLKPAQPSGVIKTEDNKGSKPVPAPLPSMEIINRNFASQCIYPHVQLPRAPGAMYGQNITPMNGMFYPAPLNRFPLPQVAPFGFTEHQTVSPALPTSSSEDDPEKSGGCAKPKSCQTEETSRKCYAPATAINPWQVQNTTAQPTESYTLNQKMTASVSPGSRSASPAMTTVSSDDFPTLDTKVSKEVLKKLKEEELRKMRSQDRFTQNYHRNVREEHRSVMQLADTLASEPLMCHRNKKIDVEEVNQQTEEFIRALSAEREQVTEKKVLDRVCRHFRVQNMRDIGIWSPVRQLSAVQELRQTQREVTIFIEAFETMRSVCTLYELNQCLGALKNKPNFEDLRLGPLCKQPLVHRLFKVPESLKDEDIFEIETVDILQSIRAYRKSSKAQKIDLADFIKYLADQYHCDSPYELGIRITSIGLLISTLGKASSTERAAIDKAKIRVQKEIEEEVDNRFNKVKRNLMDPFGGPQLYSTSGSLDLRKQYASMTAADAILQVFMNAKDVFSNKMTKHVQDFLIKIGEDRLARALFQLAICCGSLEVPQDLVAKEKTNKTAINRGRDNETPLPSEESVREYLEKSLSTVTGYLNLVYLCKLEKKLVDHFKLKGFVDMGHGTFLEYLLKHSQLLEETAGGSLFLCAQDTGICGFRPSHQDVYEFIRQCGTLGDSMFPAIEAALCKQFRVRAIKELGYRTVSSLVKMVQHQTKSHTEHNNLQSLVLYETALFFEESSHSNSSSVGLLGDLSEEQALSCLLNAPLLEDLAEWSQWETIFEAQHGSLKDFIERHCGKKAAHLSLESSAVLNDLVAIEIKPGVLLRLTTETNPELFAQAVTLHDPVGTAGHLVSIVAADGLRNAPLALLANHVETALAACGGLEANVSKTEGVTSQLSSKFILDCLIRIPVRLCKSLLQKIFLEPFSKVIGQSESKELLLQAARSSSRYLNRLHELGILLGITEWTKDYQIKLDPAKLSKLTSKATKAVDSVLVSSGSSLAGLSETEDSDVAKSESNSECKSASISSDDEVDQESEKFVLADEGSDQPPSDEKVSDHSSDIMVINSATPASSDVTNKEQCSAGIANEEESVRRNIIESIRKSEFGIGIELNDEGKKLMEVHQNRLGRSLERLSTELYSKDTHFVLELIQNADDNSYPPSSDSSPSLLFVVEKECIILLNNECGFQEKHIRAICDVGCSTKGKHEYGYIGQKGIGFKSVFKVTDTPEIHSNGFHICFNKHSGPMGYILPHWIDDTRPVNLMGTEAEKIRWTTKIVLPFKSQNQQAQNLFHDIDPSLLLFLHRLRSITVINKVKAQDFWVSRQDFNNNILEVKHKTGTDRWLVIKKILDARKIKDNVELTELALAFKLNTEKQKLAVRCLPEKQPVFAFLPLRSFGFRFIIQGDFDIPSSREDIDRDSLWNQWLRCEIPQLFLEAMETFKNHPNFKGLEGLCHFLQFLPLPDEILDFFQPVAGQIIQLLKAQTCLPTIENKDGKIEYRLPSQTAITHDALVREVITPELLQKHLNLAYLNPVLQSALNPALVSALGIHKLSSADIIAVTKAIAKELTQTNSAFDDDDMKKIAKLLVCNYRSLDQEYGNTEQLLDDLKSVPIIPLADGRMVSLKGQAIFFPLYDEENEQFVNRVQGIQELYRDLKTIHPNVLTCLDNLGNSQIRKLLERMDVYYLKPDKVMFEYILPTLKEQKWKEKSQGVVVSYSIFLKMHCQDNELQQFRPYIPVLTNKGFVCPVHVNVNFTCNYKNAINLPVDLPGVDWVLLDSCYLRTDNDSEGWRMYFSSLGVQDLFVFQKKKRTFTKQELVSSPWAQICELWPSTADNTYIVEDYVCEELHTLLTTEVLSDQMKFQQRINLLKLFDRNWDSGCRLSQYCTARLLNSQDKILKNEIHSSFAMYLATLSWLPTDSPAENGAGFCTAYLRPSEVYLRSNNLMELLANRVSYVSCDLLEKSTFAAFTGIKTSISVDMMINHFKSWCVKTPTSGSGDLEGAEFQTSAEHIHRVYAYLARNCSGSQLTELFKHFPAVFVPSSTEPICSGNFYHLKDVFWSDPTRMFQRYKYQTEDTNGPHLLAPFYHQWDDMKDLFQKTLDVEKIPAMKHYVSLLVLICSKVSFPSSDILQDVSVIYAVLAEKCKIYDNDDNWELQYPYCQTLKGMLKDEKVFPAKDNRWVSLASSPMIPDNKQLERIFKAHSLCLLNLPAAERNLLNSKIKRKQEFRFNEDDRNLFFEICGVKPLSSCISVEVQTENYVPCPKVQNFIHSLAPFIQRWLFHHDDFSHIYEDLQSSNVAARLKSMIFIQVGKLYLHYKLTLPDNSIVYENENIVCHLKDSKEFYIQKDHITSRIDICREFVKFFSGERRELKKELEHFLQSLISYFEDEPALKKFLQKEGVEELPEDEEKWEVPKALEIRPEPPRPPAPIPIQDKKENSKEILEGKDNNTDGEKTLASWPPKASLHNYTDGTSNKAAEAVMRMWPPPAPPSGSTGNVADSNHLQHHHPPPHTGDQHRTLSTSTKANGEPPHHQEWQNSQSQHEPKERTDPASISEWKTDSNQSKPPCREPTANHMPGQPPVTTSDHTSQQPVVSVTKNNHFSGADMNTPCPPIPLDVPVWTKQLPHEDVLEELLIHGMMEKPQAVVFNEDKVENYAIGEWGERLVHAFLIHWKESDSQHKPRDIMWANENGESGLPYDFKVIFTSMNDEQVETFIEVKSTIKAEKNFVQLSAQEVDLALKVKDRYHLYRVYKAGDSQNVQLCRIKNLAQCLHAKQLELFLFV
ncbi:protein NO VEIN isoform X1 [Chiloscyllium plagiosum]|uniref:protein NO VEIN isoform X1 n=2 Tax=Chiloscyllium plagiosum TaxID=36176 RepID=UPI001CB86175|nr:protein NO VEIN isoform X1 [Chiloscyllium plagiosum]